MNITNNKIILEGRKTFIEFYSLVNLIDSKASEHIRFENLIYRKSLIFINLLMIRIYTDLHHYHFLQEFQFSF